MRSKALPDILDEAEELMADGAVELNLIGQDKKVQRGKLTFILVRGIGQSFVARDVDPTQVRAFLIEKLGG